MDAQRHLAPMICCTLLACGCAPEVARVPVRITHGVEEEPFLGATDLSLQFFRGDVLEREAHFSPDATSFDVGVLNFGTALRMKLDVFAGEFVISHGGSFPFEVQASSPPPRVDLHVGRLGRFTDAQVEPLDDEVVGASAGLGGALLATKRGTLYRYASHDPSSGRPVLTRLAAHPDLAGASWVGLPDGGLVAVGGNVGRVRRFDGVGLVVAEHVDVRLLDHRRGAALATSGESLWVLGGSALDFGSSSAAFTRVDLANDAALALQPLADLPCAMRDSRAALVSIASGAAGVADRIVLACGDALRESRVVAVDPAQRGAPSELVLPGDMRRAAIAPLGLGLLLVAGGLDPEGIPTDAIHILALGEASLSEIAAASRPLFSPRVDAAIHVLAPGRVLLLGGRDAAAQPMAGAEIVAFPGSVVLTGQAPLAMPSPTLLALGDGSVLAISAAGMAVYIPAL